MTDKKKLNELMEKRIRPETKREVVQPANLYGVTSKPAKKQTSKTLKKFASYLKADSLKALKRIALDTSRKDYEVLQEAVEEYLKTRKEQS